MRYIFYNRRLNLISYGLSIAVHVFLFILLFCSFIFNLEKYNVVFVDFTPDSEVYNNDIPKGDATSDNIQQHNSPNIERRQANEVVEMKVQAVSLVNDEYVDDNYQIHDHKKAHVKFLASMDAKRIYSYEEMLPIWFMKFKPKIDKPINKTVRVVLDITIDKDGVIRSMKINNSSGDDEIDKLILEMGQKANPVPPPPDLKEGNLQRFYLPLVL